MNEFIVGFVCVFICGFFSIVWSWLFDFMFKVVEIELICLINEFFFNCFIKVKVFVNGFLFSIFCLVFSIK